MDEIDKLTQERLQREAERLIKSGKMPSLEDVCAAVLEARKKYSNQIRRARREGSLGDRNDKNNPSLI